jgi:hypothetical protein
MINRRPVNILPKSGLANGGSTHGTWFRVLNVVSGVHGRSDVITVYKDNCLIAPEISAGESPFSARIRAHLWIPLISPCWVGSNLRHDTFVGRFHRAYLLNSTRY